MLQPLLDWIDLSILFAVLLVALGVIVLLLRTGTSITADRPSALHSDVSKLTKAP